MTVPMIQPARLVLVTPTVDDPAAWPGPLTDMLAAAVAAGPVDAVILRLPALDERSLLKAVKPVIAAVQEGNAALLLEDAVSIVVRSGADGVHLTGPAGPADALDLLKRQDRIVGVGGLGARHDAMEAAETGVDYVLFGEPRRDGSVPPLPGVLERAQWWAELFQVPCVGFAPTLEAVGPMAETGCEFVAIGDAAFSHPGGAADAVRMALAAITSAPLPQR